MKVTPITLLGLATLLVAQTAYAVGFKGINGGCSTLLTTSPIVKKFISGISEDGEFRTKPGVSVNTKGNETIFKKGHISLILEKDSAGRISRVRYTEEEDQRVYSWVKPSRPENAGAEKKLDVEGTREIFNEENWNPYIRTKLKLKPNDRIPQRWTVENVIKNGNRPPFKDEFRDVTGFFWIRNERHQNESSSDSLRSKFKYGENNQCKIDGLNHAFDKLNSEGRFTVEREIANSSRCDKYKTDKAIHDAYQRDDAFLKSLE